ncbi:MAG: UDP-N-acetylmuramate--L-alanine ligase [Oscillospiraceae bacterium]|jgi:UDP-N-acetylmuramate--alanine ligase|nr:UDP-N-acetylmuramate--L-alanine ligase [Oscillospiraceae bacterium]
MVHIKDFAGKRVHMVGIGGSSMSGLAELLMKRGYSVSGTDREEGYMLDILRRQGAEVTAGHNPDAVNGADLIVYTAAIPPDNPELVRAVGLGIPALTRAELLGQLMQGHQQAVGVCGAHGKTTTSAMLAQALIGAGFDPTVHLGGRFDAIGGSTRVGGEGMFVAEACEFNASFLQLRPTIAVVLNIDADHLDYYRDIEHIQETFERFASLLPPDGVVVGNGDDPRVRQLMDRAHCRTVSFGINDGNNWRPGNLMLDERGRPRFGVIHMGKHVADVSLAVYGEFSVYNALAALAAAVEMGAEPERAAAALNAFQPVHRRFEITGTVDGVTLVHDYGHNPPEMRSATRVAAMQPHNHLWAVMQPHTYSRLKSLFADYIHCCDEASTILVTDIFAAREADPGDIHSAMLVEAMRGEGLDAVYTPTFDDAERYLRERWKPGDLALTMGCGNINLLNAQIQAHGDSVRKG